MGDLSYEQRLKSLNLPTLKYRRYRGDMIETFKLAHSLYDTKVSQQFMTFQPSNASGHNLRSHNFMIGKSHFKSDTRKFFFRCRVSSQWNSLPDYIVNAPSLNRFKNRLDKLWKNEDVIHDPDIDIHEQTSIRRSRYAVIEE